MKFPDNIRQKISYGLEWIKADPLKVRAFAFYSVLFLAIWGIFVVFVYNFQEVTSYSRMLAKTVSDASLFFLPCLFFRGKWKVIIFPYVIFLGFIILANIIYNRVFDDFIPASFYNLSALIFHPAATNATQSNFRWHDGFIIVFSLLPPVAAWVIGFKRFFRFNATLFVVGLEVFVLIASWALMLNYSYRNVEQYCEEYSWNRWYEVVFPFKDDEKFWKSSYGWLNFSGYAYRCMVEFKRVNINLTDAQKKEIREYFAKKNKGKIDKVDSINSTSPQNLIMIIVESLPSSVLNTEYSSVVAPFLTKLINDENIVSTSAGTLVKYGNSSDAQFTYITGLLPLRNEAVVINYAFYDYPSLPKALGGRSMEITGEGKFSWNHNLTTVSYGFQDLKDKSGDYGNINGDSLIFQKAKEEVKTLTSPFMLFITTLSMHEKYDFKAVEPHLGKEIEGVTNPRLREYYQRVNHFDRQLESFINYLKEKGLYDNSLILIAGDHQLLQEKELDWLKIPQVPVIILNSTKHEVKKQNVTQADVFPTILDIMGKSYRFRDLDYTGIGTSIFEESPDSLTPEDYKISDWIIRGHY